MLRLILLLSIVWYSSAEAFELIMVQAVSSSKKTFITRHGKRDGITPGVTGTFTAENVSVLAKAIHVTGGYTQWQLANPEVSFPFEKGAIVTYYPATEYIWALAPEAERKKYIKSEVVVPRESWTFRGSLTRGVSEAVSGAPAEKPNRSGFLGEVYYEKDIAYGFSWDIGMRYEKEVANYASGSVTTTRSVLIGDIYYYFDELKDYIGGRIYLGAGLGYGLSKSQTVTVSQSGPVSLLPLVKLGLDLPFNYDWSFLMDGAFESLQTKETQADGTKQSTNQTNFKASLGLRRYF